MSCVLPLKEIEAGPALPTHTYVDELCSVQNSSDVVPGGGGEQSGGHNDTPLLSKKLGEILVSLYIATGCAHSKP